MVLIICQKADKYPRLLEICQTTTASIDNATWICSNCPSNLSNGKLTVCSKANKMGFPVKPQCLNLALLEERLISMHIPFMQLSTCSNVVNVPADINSTVGTLPRPINESQTIPVRSKYHYQFQNERPKGV